MSEDPTRREAPGVAKPALGGFPDRFEPGDEIGRGGMGRVVEARDKLLGRTVALKEALATDEDALRRFARETQITARLEHPSIVPVYDAGVSPEGSPFYVMRKVTGRPLSDLIAGASSLPDRLALLPHVLAACQAVAHAHARGIIHRDLKPANILAGAHGETIVIDWGLAKSLDESDEQSTAREPLAADSLATRAGTVMGTPGFMAPEQDAGANVDERADVYALGATLHYVLAGKSPSPLPGVPSELRTIVDKALAHDVSGRYRHAGALADDLARFTTGQLVAAHDYSTRERVARFVRRHKALVITVAAALVVLAVAVVRIVAARNEAVAQARVAERARAAEAERASDLVISQARLLLASNPTGAAALVRPLAATSRWREVRAIAAGARSAGVARKLHGPESVTWANLALDGTHAVVCGQDGSVRVYDLVARTHAVVATFPGPVRAQFLDAGHLVAWAGKTLTIIDLATRATVIHERPAPIRQVDARDGFVYIVDDQARAWRLAAGTGEAIAIPVPGKAGHLAVSPDGKRVAFSGDRVWLVDVAHPDLVEQAHDARAFELAWSANSEHVAAVGERATWDITVHPEIEVAQYDLTNQAATLARGVLYSAGAMGFKIGIRSIGNADLESAMAGLHTAAGDFVVGVARDGLRVFDGIHELRIPVPGAPISLLRASLRAAYVLAVCGDEVFVWNLEHVMPRRVEVPTYAQLLAVGNNRAWTIMNNDTGAREIMLATGATRELGKILLMRHSSPASGAFVVARPLTTKETLLVNADGTSESIASDTTFAISFDDRRIVFATGAHELVIYDRRTRAKQVLGTYASTIDRIMVRETNPNWIVAGLVDGTIVRHDLVTHAVTETKLAAKTDVYSPGRATTAATASGDAYYAAGARIVRWSRTGTSADVLALPRTVHLLELLDEDHLLALADDGTGYVVRMRTADFVRVPAIGQTFTWAADDPTLVVTDDRTGGVTVLDTAVNAAWKIARAAPSGSTPDVSSDGSVVVMRDAAQDATALAVWRLDLPTSPAATAVWLADMTNATFDPRTGMLGWPP